MIRKLTNITKKHKLLVNFIMLFIFVSFIILKWWVMALGVFIITMITLFKDSVEPKEEKRSKTAGSFSDRVFNKSEGKSPIVFPVNIAGTNIVAMTYKDESGICMDIPKSY